MKVVQQTDQVGRLFPEIDLTQELREAGRSCTEPASRRSDRSDRSRFAAMGSQAMTNSPAGEGGEGSAAEEREKNRAKDDFLAKLGHELRNSLAPIFAALQLLRLQEVHSRAQAIIERQVGHLRRQVDDLLDVARITGNKLELRKRTIELADVVTLAVEISSPTLHALGHELELRVPPSGLVLDVDPERIAQCLANLLNNAAKYSAAGSQILLAAERVGDRIRVQVRDHGLGIAAEMRDRIFELFVQQKQTLARSRGGLGVGLAIVRSLVQAHGGTVVVDSEGLGKGSTFTIELPAAGGAVVAPGLEALPLAHRGAHPPGLRVLLVDDNVDTAEMMALSLGVLGYAVEVAHDGLEALHKAVHFRPEVALLDLGLPGMSGYELAAQLLRLSRVAEEPLQLIAVTGYGQDADRQRSRDMGFNHHLVKPVDLHVLNQLLSTARPS